ncbi:hypothetical protein P7C73_g4128, partial [Tremellales sp. Uapishka_1]
MDSPLLPTFSAGQSASPSMLMDDLSMNEFEPMSPTPSSSRFLPRHPAMPTEDENADEREETKKSAPRPRFSLFAPSARQVSSSTSSRSSHHEPEEEEEQGDETVLAEESGRTQTPLTSSVERDDKLRESLYELRSMNEVFEGVLGALEAARGHNERLAVRVSQTSALLDEYTRLLGQTEHSRRLIMNPLWTGAEDDAAAILAEEEAKQAAALAAQEEAERARRRVEEKERENERAKSVRESEVQRGAGGSRGRVMGAGTGTGRGRGGSSIPTANRAYPGFGPKTGLKKPSTASTTTSTSGGIGGQYKNVKSSGYGPK